MLSETTSPVLPSVVHKLQIMNFLLKHKSVKLSGYVIGTGPEKQVIIYLYRPEKNPESASLIYRLPYSVAVYHNILNRIPALCRDSYCVARFLQVHGSDQDRIPLI